MSARDLARTDVLSLRGYRAAEQLPDTIRLNANEAPLAQDSDANGLNRYPKVHPVELQERLAALFQVPAENLLVTRGSSEAIDVLMRAFCAAGRDNVVLAAPTFEMYRFYADLQGAEVRELALTQDCDFEPDVNDLLDLCTQQTKLLIVCSPNNPTGNIVSMPALLELVEARKDRSLIVVDEAYIEFSDQESLAAKTSRYDNLVVLRTLSKAHSLAGARCGVAIAHPDLVDVFTRVLPPYSFPTPVIQRVLKTLSEDNAARSAEAIARIVAERERVLTSLREIPVVEHVWSSQANFLLVKVRNINQLQDYLAGKRILVRNFTTTPGLRNCVRITIGTAAENDAMLGVLENMEIVP